MFWQLELYLFSLKSNEGSIMHSGVSTDLVWLWAAVFNVQYCVPLLLDNRCGLSCTELAGSHVELGFCVDINILGVCLCFNIPWSQDYEDDP